MQVTIMTGFHVISVPLQVTLILVKVTEPSSRETGLIQVEDGSALRISVGVSDWAGGSPVLKCPVSLFQA